jgi:hypothetical protein
MLKQTKLIILAYRFIHSVVRHQAPTKLLKVIPEYAGGVQSNFSRGSYPVWVKVKSSGPVAQFRITSARCGAASGQLQVIPLLPGDWEMGHGRWGEGPPAYDLPDVVDGELFGGWVHLRVANVGQGWLRDVTLRVLPSAHVAAASSPAARDLAPGQRAVVFAPLQAHAGNVTQISGSACPLAVQVAAHGADGARLSGPEPFTLRLRCRSRGESFLFTFLDSDGSVQAAGARAPAKDCRGAGCAVLLSLHGMDVTAQRQADAYRSHRRRWVLAPHGRATHAFFWQGPAHWHALAALAALRRHAAVWHKGRFRAGLGRMLTGHSNGGYGALLLAALEPALALAVAPLAGMPLLGDAGRDPAAALHTGEPGLEAVLAAAAAEYRVDLMARNLRGVPLLARTGAQDEVP